MTDGDALLAAIRAEPGDDTARLVYADWLDENADTIECPECRGEPVKVSRWRQAEMDKDDYGESTTYCGNCKRTGHVSDGRRERAEFIRVQVELANFGPNDSNIARHMSLSKRERELWSKVYDQFDVLPVVQADANGIWTTTLDHIRAASPNPRTWREAIVRRGFVDEIRCPLAAYLGGPCEWCQGSGEERVADAAGDMGDEPCRVCKGDRDYRTPGLAAELHAAHPIQVVRPTDKRPRESASGWWWTSRLAAGTYHDSLLPDEVFRRLPDVRPSTVLSPSYPTEQAAYDTLSAALVSIGRKRAKEVAAAAT